MNKFCRLNLMLDTESINRENELHSNNFGLKIRNLAEHCVNYVYGRQDENDCLNNKYNREYHDQELSMFNAIESDHNSNKKKFTFYQIINI